MVVRYKVNQSSFALLLLLCYGGSIFTGKKASKDELAAIEAGGLLKSVAEDEYRDRAMTVALEREARRSIVGHAEQSFDKAVVACARSGDRCMLQQLRDQGGSLLRDYAHYSLLHHVIDAESKENGDTPLAQRLRYTAEYLLSLVPRHEVQRMAMQDCSDQMASLLISRNARMLSGQFLPQCCLTVRRALLENGYLNDAGCWTLLQTEAERHIPEQPLAELLAFTWLASDGQDEQLNQLLPLVVARRIRCSHVLGDIKSLLDVGAAINTRDEQGNTVLMLAAKAGSFDLVDFLLARGADPTIADKRGSTALHKAAESGCESVVWRLLLTKCFAQKQIAGTKGSAEAVARAAKRNRIADILCDAATRSA